MDIYKLTEKQAADKIKKTDRGENSIMKPGPEESGAGSESNSMLLIPVLRGSMV